MLSSYCTRDGAEDHKISPLPEQDSPPAIGVPRAGQQSESARSVRRYDLVVMAASAGGVQALQAVLSVLPVDFPVPIAVVQHRSTRLPNLLVRVLARHTPLTVKMAEPSEAMQPGTVYLAPPDLHLSVQGDGTLALSDGQKIRHVRSSANPLFESAAGAFGGRIIAVVLTGGDRDATDGVQSVKAHGGTVITQDEATSQCFGMPHAAIETGCVDWVLPLEDIGPRLIDLMKGAAASTGGVQQGDTQVSAKTSRLTSHATPSSRD